MGTPGIQFIILRPSGECAVRFLPQSTGPIAMGAQRRPFFLPLLFGLFFALSGQAQVDFDLEVDVVMDTVLYDGFVGAGEVVPDGFRRYRLYAVFPDDAEIMLGPSADDSSDPAIPGFGYSSDCGCFNSFGAGGTLTSTPVPRFCRPICRCFPKCNTTRGGPPTSASPHPGPTSSNRRAPSPSGTTVVRTWSCKADCS